MLRDAEHFKTRIGGLDGAGDTGDFIVKLVKEKSVPRPGPAPAAPEAATNGKDPTPEISENGKEPDKNEDEKAPG